MTIVSVTSTKHPNFLHQMGQTLNACQRSSFEEKDSFDIMTCVLNPGNNNEILLLCRNCDTNNHVTMIYRINKAKFEMYPVNIIEALMRGHLVNKNHTSGDVLLVNYQLFNYEKEIGNSVLIFGYIKLLPETETAPIMEDFYAIFDTQNMNFIDVKHFESHCQYNEIYTLSNEKLLFKKLNSLFF